MSMVKLYAGGKMRSSPLRELYETYHKRITSWKIVLQECVGNSAWGKLSKSPGERWILLDERGDMPTSAQIERHLEHVFVSGKIPVFCIGEMDGLPQSIRSQGDTLWSFGRCTWPHLWVRVLVMEQLYRAQQLKNRHPYSLV